MSETPQAPLPFVYQFAAGAVAGVSEVCLSCFCFGKRFRLHSLCRKPPRGAVLTNASLPARTDPDYVRLSTPLLWSHDYLYWRCAWYSVEIGPN